MKKLFITLGLLGLLSCGSHEESDYRIITSMEFEETNFTRLKKLTDDFARKHPESDKLKEIKELKNKIIKQENILKEYRDIEINIRNEKGSYIDKLNKKLIMTENFKNKYLENKIIDKVEEDINKIKLEINEEEKKINALKEKEKFKKNINKKIYSKYDEFQDTRWFYGKDEKGNHTSKKSKFYIYGGGSKHSNSPTFLRVVFQYRGDNWIFFDDVKIIYDGILENLDLSNHKYKRDAFYGGVYEIYDLAIDNSYIEKFNKICQAKTVKIRFTGEYYYEFKLSKSDKEKVLNIIMAYEY